MRVQAPEIYCEKCNLTTKPISETTNHIVAAFLPLWLRNWSLGSSVGWKSVRGSLGSVKPLEEGTWQWFAGKQQTGTPLKYIIAKDIKISQILEMINQQKRGDYKAVKGEAYHCTLKWGHMYNMK